MAICWGAWHQADGHGAGVVTKSLLPYPQVGGREPTGNRIDFLNIKAHPQ